MYCIGHFLCRGLRRDSDCVLPEISFVIFYYFWRWFIAMKYSTFLLCRQWQGGNFGRSIRKILAACASPIFFALLLRKLCSNLRCTLLPTTGDAKNLLFLHFISQLLYFCFRQFLLRTRGWHDRENVRFGVLFLVDFGLRGRCAPFFVPQIKGNMLWSWLEVFNNVYSTNNAEGSGKGSRAPRSQVVCDR